MNIVFPMTSLPPPFIQVESPLTKKARVDADHGLSRIASASATRLSQ